jgi:hypothetical protein
MSPSFGRNGNSCLKVALLISRGACDQTASANLLRASARITLVQALMDGPTIGVNHGGQSLPKLKQSILQAFVKLLTLS